METNEEKEKNSLMNKNINIEVKEKYVKIIFVVFFTLLALVAACKIEYDNAPDEDMKYIICKYIYEHGSIPNGYDSEVINKYYGTSYAFKPILQYMFSGLFMKIFSMYSPDIDVMIIAARLPSVLCYCGIIIMCMKIGDLLFKNKNLKWIFITLTCCLPQLIFIGSYINNDSLAIFSIFIIVYSWILGLRNKWNYKSVIWLAIGLSLCALSYYNAYGFILTSAILFIVSFFINKENNKIDIKNLFKKGFIIVGIVILLAGWWFIRSYIIYDGDFLGQKSFDKCVEMYGVEKCKEKHRRWEEENVTPWELVNDGHWVHISIDSYIGKFGYMCIELPEVIYNIYRWIYAIGGIGAIIYIIRNIKQRIYIENKNKMLFEIIMFVNIIIPIVLSIYFSCSTEYQPQGRYIMPGLIAISYFVSNGIGTIIELLKKIVKNKWFESTISYALMVCLIIIAVISVPLSWICNSDGYQPSTVYSTETTEE